jgi:hypothetical protein
MGRLYWSLHQLMHTAIFSAKFIVFKGLQSLAISEKEKERKLSLLAIVSLIIFGNAWLPHIL